jgi:prevent-host-death family protein
VKSRPRLITARAFKASGLKLIDEVARRREPLVITKHGKPVACPMPIPEAAPLFGALAGSVVDEDDIVAPFEGKPWRAER